MTAWTHIGNYPGEKQEEDTKPAWLNFVLFLCYLLSPVLLLVGLLYEPFRGWAFVIAGIAYGIRAMLDKKSSRWINAATALFFLSIALYQIFWPR